MQEIIELIQQDLKNVQDFSDKSRFFKEDIKSYGVKNPEVNKIALSYYKEIKVLSKDQIFNLCTLLWQSGYIEESLIACSWSKRLHKKYTPNDFPLFQIWVEKYVNNWASCDTLCNHTVGTFLEMYPEFLPKLILWSKSTNRWVKRATAVSLIVPAKKGLFLPEIFKIADNLLMDSDDLVQKGYGWMLKEAATKHQNEVFNFIMERKDKMPRTALRYAIEKMPEDLRQEAMKK